MSQRNVELLLGRLLTDAELRRRFSRAPLDIVREFCAQGWELNCGEMAALAEVDMRLWSQAAASLPSRLQPCQLYASTSRVSQS